MYDRILKRLRTKVLAKKYVMSIHAEEEMNDDELTIFDVEHGILTGQIIERQKDQHTNEWKFLVSGRTLTNSEVVIVTKLSPTGKLVIITVYFP